jgi:predicted nucleic acid-binding protein
MKKAILDTNIWFSATLGGDISLHLPKALDCPNLTVLICPELLNEFNDVIGRPKLQ